MKHSAKISNSFAKMIYICVSKNSIMIEQLSFEDLKNKFNSNKSFKLGTYIVGGLIAAVVIYFCFFPVTCLQAFLIRFISIHYSLIGLIYTGCWYNLISSEYLCFGFRTHTHFCLQPSQKKTHCYFVFTSRIAIATFISSSIRSKVKKWVLPITFLAFSNFKNNEIQLNN